MSSETDEFFSRDTRRELVVLTDSKEIEDRFYRDLEFGTGGLRGIMGAGTNRMNKYTVGKVTIGLARYLVDNYPDARERGVTIVFDTRNHSEHFARVAADVYLLSVSVCTSMLMLARSHSCPLQSLSGTALLV